MLAPLIKDAIRSYWSLRYYADKEQSTYKTFFDFVTTPYKPQMCGCLGPIDEAPQCPCSMRQMRFMYCYEIIDAVDLSKLFVGYDEYCKEQKDSEEKLECNFKFLRDKLEV